MPTRAPQDPRSIVTPDAFGIDERLLGTPLADPWRRFWAMMIDLVVIGLLTVVLSSIQLLVWGAVALFFIRMAVQRSDRASQAAALLLRVFAGCLGLTILSTVLIVLLVLRAGSGDAGRVFQETERVRPVREAVEEAAPSPGEGDAASEDLAGDTTAPGDMGGTVEEDVAALTDAEALEALARLVEEEGASSAREEALRRRVAALVAGDTIARLRDSLARTAERTEDYEDEVEDLEEEVRDLRSELEERDSGVAELLRDIWDQAGSAIGLWSIYFTVLLTLWKGQTVGKKLTGLRVLRLDGQPMTWWSSFERGGGYVAGLATGLLGFAQVFWDPNRQCIHDKIVGTVVVRDGARVVPGAWHDARGAVERPRTSDSERGGQP